MDNRLNISNLAYLNNVNSNVVVREKFAIIRDIAQIKSQMLASGMGALFYVPLGRVLLVTSGEAQLRINMQPCRVKANQVLVIPENFFLEVLAVDVAYDAQIVTFSNIANPFRRWTLVPIGSEDAMRVRSFIDLLWQVAHSPACQQSTLDTLLLALLGDIHSLSTAIERECPSTPPSAAEQLMQRFFDFLAESDGTLRSVPAVAEQLCISPNHLSAVIKQQTGQTVMQLLNAHTVLKIKVMLRLSTLPVYELSDRFGFENTPSFCRFFKREAGVSPLQFRRQSSLPAK